MSFTSTPLPKMSRTAVNLNPLLNIKTLSSPNDCNKSPTIDKFPSQRIEKVVQPNEQKKDKSKQKYHPKGNILHVSNICSKLTYEQIKKGLYNLFSVHGPIFEIIIKTKESGQHFAFVDYPDITHAQNAWRAARTEGKRLQNKLLIVNYCEDPKKNIDRKDQKCFLCHGTGHKAIRCPVKPEMIKPKPKKIQQNWSQQDQTNCGVDQFAPMKTSKEIAPAIKQHIQDQYKQSQQSESEQIQRDKDYLRFLKLKKKLLQKKLKKKVKKSKKRKN